MRLVCILRDLKTQISRCAQEGGAACVMGALSDGQGGTEGYAILATLRVRSANAVTHCFQTCINVASTFFDHPDIKRHM